MDREKVINGLRSIKTYLASQAIESTDNFSREGFIESQRDIDDAIAMLKEQETHKFFVDESGKITPLPVVVRCKDCKFFAIKEHWADIGHGAKVLCADKCPTCEKWGEGHGGGCKTEPDGYCFLAEKRSE